jgi:hypothetical protein
MNVPIVHRFFTITIPLGLVALLVGCSKSTPTSPIPDPIPGTSAQTDALGIPLKGLTVSSNAESLFFSFSCDSALHVIGVLIDMDQDESTGKKLIDGDGIIPGGYDFYENYPPMRNGKRYRVGLAWRDAFGGNVHAGIGWLLLVRTNIESHWGIAWGSQ